MGVKRKVSRGMIIGVLITVAIVGLLGNRLLLKLRSAGEQAEAIGCRSRLNGLILGARLWANEHGGVFPTNYLSMAPEYLNARVLACPQEKGNPLSVATNWQSFNPQDVSYELISPGMADGDGASVFARCRNHGFTCYGDSRVEDFWHER